MMLVLLHGLCFDDILDFDCYILFPLNLSSHFYCEPSFDHEQKVYLVLFLVFGVTNSRNDWLTVF